MGFRLKNSVGMIGVRPLRPASGTISRDLLALRRRNANSSARLPFGGCPGSEPREESLAALLPPVPSERPFDELPVQLLAPIMMTSKVRSVIWRGIWKIKSRVTGLHLIRWPAWSCQPQQLAGCFCSCSAAGSEKSVPRPKKVRSAK